jgi:hypothetical protein
MDLTPPNHDGIWTESNINDAFAKTTKVLEQYQLIQNFKFRLVDAVVPDLNNPSELIVTDNFLKKEHVRLWPEFYGNYFYNPRYILRDPKYLFNCFMGRSDPFRQSWLYQFQRLDLLDQGLVTFNLDYRDSDFSHLAGTVELFDVLFNSGNGIFEKEHKILRDKVPFCNFNTSLEQAIVDSKVSVVIETYFDRENIVAVSEKIFRAIQHPRPILLFSSPGAIQHIRNCGFDMLDDIVDHSYDQEQSHVTRQMMILKQLENISKLQYDVTLVNRMELANKHNRNRLWELLQQWPSYFQKICKQLQDYK